ncbi:MAG: helix-turn-helix domain-containing protein [Methyloprofundus sp.]|nr:helix-turn-helix domain-containing protein [Methyloprofundus sp.]
MEPIALHRTTIIRPFIEFLTEIGAPVNRTLQQLKLPTLALSDPDYYISSIAFWKFVEIIAVKEGIQDLGFLVGREFGVTAIDPNYSQILAQLPTLYQALLKTCHAVKTETSRSDMLVYSTVAGNTHFCHRTSFGIKHPNHSRMELYALMGMIGIIQEFTGATWQPKEIGLMSYQKPSLKIRESLANCRFLNGQAYGFVSIETSLLSLPPLLQSQGNRDNSKEALMTSQFGGSANDFLGSLKQLLQSYVQEGAPTIGLAAEMANTSVRSLQRELAKSKLSYRDLLTQIRYTTAISLLKDSELHVQEVAYQLGYQNASHFARAFRRVAGMSPIEYKQSRNQGKISDSGYSN